MTRWMRTSTDFTVEHAAGWVVGNGRLPTATGQCPRCCDWTNFNPWQEQNGEDLDEQFPYECDCRCDQRHEGRPDNVEWGCGAIWHMHVVHGNGSPAVLSTHDPSLG